MQNRLRTLGAVLLLSAFHIVPANAQEDTIEWLDNYEKAIQEAKRTNKPIFLEFRCEA
jgi:uncharacterized protein YyaL (SSP411 family)